jgi:hypothetical protein
MIVLKQKVTHFTQASSEDRAVLSRRRFSLFLWSEQLTLHVNVTENNGAPFDHATHRTSPPDGRIREVSVSNLGMETGNLAEF